MLTYERENPADMVEAMPSDQWQVGHVFRWSELYVCWLYTGLAIAINPHEVPRDAYHNEVGEPCWSEYGIFVEE